MVIADDLDVTDGFDVWLDPNLAALPPLERLRTPIRILGTRADLVLVELRHADAVTEITVTPSLRPGASAITRHQFALACEAAVIAWCPTCLRSAVEGTLGHSDGCQRGSTALATWLSSAGLVRVVGRRVRRLNVPAPRRKKAPASSSDAGASRASPEGLTKSTVNPVSLEGQS